MSDATVMTNEREAAILDDFVAGMHRDGVDLFAVTVLADLISALVGNDDGIIRLRLAAAHVLLDALELVHGDTSEYEINYLRVIERSNREEIGELDDD